MRPQAMVATPWRDAGWGWGGAVKDQLVGEA